MSIFHRPQYEHELFWRYYGRMHAFLAYCDYCLKKLEILNIVFEGVNCETRAFFSIGIFVLETLMKPGNCLSSQFRILMNLRLVVLILTPHPPVFLIMVLLRVRFAIVLAMIVILFLSYFY